jgi:Ca2+/H+ antiporter
MELPSCLADPSWEADPSLAVVGAFSFAVGGIVRVASDLAWAGAYRVIPLVVPFALVGISLPCAVLGDPFSLGHHLC